MYILSALPLIHILNCNHAFFQSFILSNFSTIFAALPLIHVVHCSKFWAYCIFSPFLTYTGNNYLVLHPCFCTFSSLLGIYLPSVYTVIAAGHIFLTSFHSHPFQTDNPAGHFFNFSSHVLFNFHPRWAYFQPFHNHTFTLYFLLDTYFQSFHSHFFILSSLLYIHLLNLYTVISVGHIFSILQLFHFLHCNLCCHFSTLPLIHFCNRLRQNVASHNVYVT